MATGIICEYNPFHNGHKLHIDKTKSCCNDDIIAVMSGNYVQRGEPAVIDKWFRTKSALENGVDIVLELPTPFATASAEFFSAYAVKILENTGIVDRLSFGSENGEVTPLYDLAKIIVDEPPEYKQILKSELDKGVAYPTARSKAVLAVADIDKLILDSPNNILAIEYIKSIIKTNSKIKPFTIQREKTGYHDTTSSDGISSATGIRNAIKNNDFDFITDSMPCCENLLTSINIGKAPVFFDDFSSQFNYKIRTASKEDIKNILDVTEGLENRIFSAANSVYNLSEYINFINTKRYTQTKIQRALLHILLNITKSDFDEFYNSPCPYIRVLGFRKDKSHVLKALTEKSTAPIITNINKLPDNLSSTGKKMLQMEIVSTDIYFSSIPNKKFSQLGQEFTTPIVII